MISDCDQRRSSIKSLRSASLVSSLFESATSIIHPLEPSVEIVGFDSLSSTTTERHTLFDSTQLSHAYRSTISAVVASNNTKTTYNTAITKNNIDPAKTPTDISCISEERNRRPISRNYKSSHCSESASQFFRGGGRAPRSFQTPSTNMEFLRGVYAFMQVSRSSINHVKIDSAVFRLHTNATVILLVTFSIAVTTRQYVGNPIDCVHTRDIPEDVLNTYCWIHSTYTVVDAFMKKQGEQVPFPGVDNSLSRGQLTIKHTKYYQWVAFTLFFQIAFSLIVTTRQYVGNPIDCVHTKDIPEDVLNTYCWIHSTYALKSMFLKKTGKEVPYPGVGNSEGKTEDRKVYKYYQWVCFCLFFQSILFYAPRWLWKSWEGGKIHALMMDLDIGICSEIEKKQKKKLLLDYLWDNLRYHNWWAYRYYGCELLSLINVVGQMFLMNKFFDGEFMTFGLDVIRHMEADQEDRMDPMIYIFPRMTKCTFYKYGVSGEVERHDAICILPLNVVNEKIYIFLWFWFILLTFLTSLTVMYRIVIIFSPRMRVYLLRLRFRLVRRDAIEIIVRRSKMGDWFLLYMLGENIDSIIFRDVMGDLANRLNNNQHHRVPGLKGDIQDA